MTAVAKQIDSLVENTNQIAVRWGGEEFIYAALNITQENILEIANALRLKVWNLKIPNQNFQIGSYMTISLGTCTGTVANTKNINEVIKIADHALYRAKNSGRNCVSTLVYEEYSVE